jgi:Tfp pilus assembly protein PilX
MAMSMKNFQFPISNFQKKRGFALLIAVIFMSVMLSFGLALGSLGYKQQVLASSAIASQYAFYAADAALECALYADQQQNIFEYASHNAGTPPNLITSVACNDATATQFQYSYTTGASGQLIVAEHLDWGNRCADVTVYKYNTPLSSGVTTYVFSQGYDVPCAVVGSPSTSRFVSRGQSAHY